ncbi:MAG: uroporphyrinogen decarboxylase family protein [Clostridia bacterium]|nr:uroporphyrinogen decarboxylase family protein [Clostridia bacterium]
MNIRKLLWDTARSDHKRALPILSFPAAQKLGVTVEALVKSANLQAQAMQIIAQETETLAAVSLMDLSVEAEAFGAQVRFTADEVPAIVGQLVSDEDEANALAVPALSAGRALLCVEAVRQAKSAITDKPVIAGMIGPYSLAGRLMDVTEIMYLCFDEPETVHTVLDKAAQYLIKYGQAMKAAGADGVMMAEPLAGILSPAMAEEFSMPYVARIIATLQDEDFAVIYHNCGNAVPQMLESIYAQGAAAYHFGNAVDMTAILQATPADVLVMGNIDPAGEFASGTVESITAATRELMAKCGAYRNFLPSSGCDIPAHAKWENIHAFFAAIRS